jgi:hypothetical protein
MQDILGRAAILNWDATPRLCVYKSLKDASFVYYRYEYAHWTFRQPSDRLTDTAGKTSFLQAGSPWALQAYRQPLDRKAGFKNGRQVTFGQVSSHVIYVSVYRNYYGKLFYRVFSELDIWE